MICGNESLEESVEESIVELLGFHQNPPTTLNFVCVSPAPNDRSIYDDFYERIVKHGFASAGVQDLNFQGRIPVVNESLNENHWMNESMNQWMNESLKSND